MHNLIVIVFYLAGGLVVVLPAILVWDWFHEGMSKGLIAAAILVALIVLPILAVFGFCLFGPGKCRA